MNADEQKRGQQIKVANRVDSRTKAAGKAVRVAKAASRVVRADNAKAARVATINGSVAALRFFFTVTLDRPEMARHLTFVRGQGARFR